VRKKLREGFRGVFLPAGLCLILAAAAHGQAPAPGLKPVPPALSTASTPILPPPGMKPEPRAGYELGPDDQVSVSVLDLPEISDKTYRIDLNGFIKLPMVGERIQAAGLTVEQLEDEIARVCKTFLKDPQVTVSVVTLRRETVNVLGSVRSPGVIQLLSRMTLVDVITAAGGLSDDAGYTLRLVRRREYGRIPLPSAADDPSGEYSIAEISAKEILDATNPAQNIPIFPQDEITVPRGEMVYVIGNVGRQGAFVLQQQANLSVLQILALAGGTDKGAAPKNTKILRPPPGGGARTEIPINLSAILHSKAPDVGLQAGDILFVPASNPKKALLRIGDAAATIAVGTAGLLVYRIP
jgi:polysaccharide export outer membrane protein